MNLESFKREIEEIGNRHIDSAIKELESKTSHISFTNTRSKLYNQLMSACNDTLTSYASEINPTLKITHPTLDRPTRVVELVTLHYYSVFPPLLTKFMNQVDYLYSQKFPEDHPEKD